MNRRKPTPAPGRPALMPDRSPPRVLYCRIGPVEEAALLALERRYPDEDRSAIVRRLIREAAG